MNFNRVLTLLPILVLVGCGSSGQYAEPTSGTGSTGGPVSTSRQAAQVELASNAQTPAMKKAAAKRAVIRNGSLSVRVPKVEEAERKVNDYVSRVGGFVSSSESSDLTAASPTITLTARVPADGFDQAMLFFESLGTRLSKSVKGEDVTAQLVDFDARLKIMRAQEDSFRKMLSEARDNATSNDLQTRIMQLRGEIESLAGQRKAMADLAALSTFSLTLVGETKGMAEVEDKGWAQESWNSSTTLFAGVFRGVGSIGIFLLVFSPIWVPAALVAFWLIRRSTRPTA